MTKRLKLSRAPTEETNSTLAGAIATGGGAVAGVAPSEALGKAKDAPRVPSEGVSGSQSARSDRPATSCSAPRRMRLKKSRSAEELLAGAAAYCPGELASAQVSLTWPPAGRAAGG